MRPSILLGFALIAFGCKNKDSDGDGYGALDDCDDENDGISPGAAEICDGIDNNCDGNIDEDLLSTWYADVDGDGYGDTADTEESCDQPAGYVDNADDCNDASALYYPGASEDDCTDPNDYNCDGSVGYEDADDDGFAACEECDDTSAEINPDAAEVCDGEDNNCDNITDTDAEDAVTWYIDYDDDGYGNDEYQQTACEQPSGWVDNADDCDDTSALALPGGTEICDGLDNDCDGEYDEDSEDRDWYYSDSDGDGYGDADLAVEACEAPANYVEDDTDCDDDNADANPGADEVCDDVDNDCDGLVDDDDTDVDSSSVTIYYADNDGDGYGATSEVVLACSTPDGYVDNVEDCDDDDEDINPDATESCDGADNDCDGETDESDADDATTWYLDSDGDGYGVSDTTTVDCDEPSGYADNADDCDDDDGDVSPGQEEVCNDGLDNDCDGSAEGCTLELADSDIVFVGGAAGDEAGYAISNAGDLDSDGYDEFLIGARSADDEASDGGTSYLYWGSSLNTMAGEYDLADADVLITGPTENGKSGKALAGGTDLDGDAVSDFVIAAPNATNGGTAKGYIYVFSGASFGTSDISLSDADLTIYGTGNYDYFGGIVHAAGNVNDSTYGSYLIGAIGEDKVDDVGESNGGGVYLLTGPITSGTIAASDIDDVLLGRASNENIGARFRNAGDVDGDGLNDIVVGSVKDSTNGSSAGAVYLVVGGVSGATSVSDATATLYGDSGDQAGTAVSSLGDQNGDGYDEFTASAPLEDSMGTDAGALYIVAGSATPADLDAAELADSAWSVVYGSTSSVSIASHDGNGDVDDDGTNDLLVSSTNSSGGAGETYVFFGPVTGSPDTSEAWATLVGETADDSSGSPVTFAGDVTGGGENAIAISAQKNDAGGTDAGAAYLIKGIDE